MTNSGTATVKVQPDTEAFENALDSAFDAWLAKKSRPAAAVIEIVERSRRSNEPGAIVPDDVRINGQSLLVAADEPVVVHQISTRDRDVVRVTLTLLAKRVSIRGEEDAP